MSETSDKKETPQISLWRIYGYLILGSLLGLFAGSLGFAVFGFGIAGSSGFFDELFVFMTYSALLSMPLLLFVHTIYSIWVIRYFVRRDKSVFWWIFASYPPMCLLVPIIYLLLIFMYTIFAWALKGGAYEPLLITIPVVPAAIFFLLLPYALLSPVVTSLFVYWRVNNYINKTQQNIINDEENLIDI